MEIVNGLLGNATVHALAQRADVGMDAVTGDGVVDDRLDEVRILGDRAEWHLGAVERRERVVVPDVPADLDVLVEELGRAVDPLLEGLIPACHNCSQATISG